MDSQDLEVLRQCVNWLQAGHAVTLGTVTRTWGSSPRPVGAMLALRDDGLVAGSVSGGCIEDDLIRRAREGKLIGARPEVATYGVTAEEARRFGLPCGGTLQLVLETMSDLAAWCALLERVKRRELTARVLDIATGTFMLRAAAAGETHEFDGGTLVTLHGPRYRLLIIGAGQLSRFLAHVALGLDYEVTICDPRREYGAGWDLPGVTRVDTMPDDTVLAMTPDYRTAVVALTHDPKLDDMALMEALRSQAFYVGAIGSRYNSRRRRERLRELDLSEAEIARLHGPIGIPIGSRTPPEIAISILADMTACRNGVVAPSAPADAPAKAWPISACAAG
jgi:xanthine dehydrogenase accessory factor